ncbi:MauE/DoxX family redox-associated membrane protein [Subtercola endophyticus]|uniref:MauE/DoxX family redox-associated membrane protein n=1 Tax=Subtercola endophyticus TaxID=2895559 RepID=UPI001E2BFA1F|nr:MauE/DoxX family redox-associated membrane protein [Subtercola endophyticus]UFS60828.1 hypothetical protein LQ955_08865 [Subtercola endophyticus]
MSPETWLAIQLVCTALVGGSLVLSGLLKLRDVEGTADSFRSFGVPALIDRRSIHRSYPYIEIVVGVGVVIAPSPVWWPMAVIAGLVLATLSILVGGVLVRSVAVSCNCFGSKVPVTWRTLARNVLLVGGAVVLVGASPSAPSPVIVAMTDNSALIVSTFGAAGATVLLSFLSRASSRRAIPRGAQTAVDRALPIPDLTLFDDDRNPVALPSLVASGAALLVFVKHGCSACEKVVNRVSDGELIAGSVVVRVVERMPADRPAAKRSRLWDDRAEVARTLTIRNSPAAILLALDGTIPADPVYGADQIGELIEAIESAVQQSRRPDIGALLDTPGVAVA